MVVRVENNNGGQNVGGQRSGENLGSALGQLRNTLVSFSVEEQVIRAELCWVLKLVESDFSFKSADNMVKLLCLMDKDSKIFPKMTLGRKKCSYFVTHALYPFHHGIQSVTVKKKSPTLSLACSFVCIIPSVFTC